MSKRKPAPKETPDQVKEPETIKEKVEIPTGPKKESLPPAPPPPPEREEEKGSGPGISEKEPAPEDLEIKKVELDLVDICSDILDTGFGLWHDWNPNVPVLDPHKKEMMELRMARLVRKWDLAKYCKDEIIFFGLLSWEISKRLKIKRPPKDVKDHIRKERERENTPGQKDRPI